MFCDKCGKKYDEDSRFCSGCGAPRKERPTWQVAEEQLADDKTVTTVEQTEAQSFMQEEQAITTQIATVSQERAEGPSSAPPPLQKSTIKKTRVIGTIIGLIVGFAIGFGVVSFLLNNDRNDNNEYMSANNEPNIIESDEIESEQPVPEQAEEGEAEPEQAEEREAETSQIIGEWQLAYSPNPDFMEWMRYGWMFDEVFYEDGTGISYWFAPEVGRVDMIHFTWEANNGRLTMIITWFDEETFHAGWGDDGVDEMRERVRTPTTSTYTISNNVLTIIGEGGTSVFEKIQDTTSQIDDTTQDTSQIIGDWIAISIPREPFITAMQQGWEYGLEFLADGNGTSWWYSPEAGWLQAYHFTWSTSSGQLTYTLTEVNEEVVEHYLGSAAADALVGAIGQPSFFRYNVEDDTLKMTIHGITAIYERY